MKNRNSGGILIGVLIILIAFITLGFGYITTSTRHYVIQKKSVKTLQYTYMPKGNASMYDAYDSIYNRLLNAPKLAPKMTPVKFDSTSNTWVTAQSNNSDGWYEYGRAKKWANIRLPDGSLYVWIPRYTYKITYTNPGDYSQGGTIAIKFSKGIADDTSNGYIVHPAFNFGGTELEGIWVAKFEASNDGTGKIQSLAGSTSYASLSIAGTGVADTNNAFYKCTQIKVTHSLAANTDSHLLKNSEWGAVVYLAKAIGAEPQKNTSSPVRAGGNSSISTIYTTNINQSTTGNPYGIYDMNGGNYEFVASYLSGYTTNLYLLVNGNAKYSNVFSASVTPATATANYGFNASTRNGMAINETSTTGNVNNKSWSASEAFYTYDVNPVFIRGGNTTNTSMYAFSYSNGAAAANISFRPSIVVY